MMRVAILLAFAAIALVIAALAGSVNDAQSNDATLELPSAVGETWQVCQGYNSPTVSHHGIDVYGLDLIPETSVPLWGSTGCLADQRAAGRTVLAPADGNIDVTYSTSLGLMCIHLPDGKSIKVGHIDPLTPPLVSGPVSQGDPIGKVSSTKIGSQPVAHIHISVYDSSDCNSNPIPFSSADGTTISGYDLPSDGSINQYGCGTVSDLSLCTLAKSDGPQPTVTPPPPPNQPPTADADGPYTTDEGNNKQLDGTGSSDDVGIDLYEWNFDGDDQFDDATGARPTFTMVGQDGVFPIGLRVTDEDGLSDDDNSSYVRVNNVPPSVSLSSNAPKDEGSAVTVSGTVTDPGWLDPLSATIDWGDGTPPEPTGGILENVRPNATLTFNVSHVYGDNGTFTAQVCADDDDTTTCETIDLQIDNVDPTAEIDMSGAILVNGVPTFIAHIGDQLDFSGRSTDPGSDDLYLSWDWDDGTPVVTTTYLVNPPFPDPFPSPSIQPRDVTDAQSHTYADACFYQIEFWVGDDDGGVSPVDTANVIIVGNAEDARTAGYWMHQYRSHLTGLGRPHFDGPTLGCYLDIAGYMSQVFDEERDASTFDQAHDVLFVNNTSDMTEMLDQQLLAVWLNFANGSVEYDQMVDTDGDKVPDAVFLDAMAAAEAVRLDAGATRMELEMKKNFLESLNRMK